MQIYVLSVLYKLQLVFTFSLFLSPALVQKHHRIILNYYLRYMSGFDAQLMRNVVMVSVNGLPQP